MQILVRDFEITAFDNISIQYREIDTDRLYFDAEGHIQYEGELEEPVHA